MAPMWSRITWKAALALLAAGLLSACGSPSFEADNDVDFVTQPRFEARLDLTAGVLPSATNLLLSGSADGTLNIPIAATDSAGTQALKRTLNALDGFSTVAPLSTSFGAAVAPASISGSTVKVFEVTLTGIGGAVTGITRELAYGGEFVAALSSVDPTGKTLAILWLRPLKPKASYLVALTDGIRSVDGRSAIASAHYLTAKGAQSLMNTPSESLEGVRKLVGAQEAALVSNGVARESVVLSWTFTTQSIGDVLTKVRAQATGTAAAAPTGLTASQALGGGAGKAAVYAGTLTAPYYLDATKPLTGVWQPGSPAAGEHVTYLNVNAVGVKKTVDQTMPLLLTVPNASSGFSKPVTGWPVVIFQHGVTSDRSAMLAIAETLASAGFATVAVDLPLHGVGATSPLRVPGVAERSFDLDYLNNATGAPGPDGVADSSGAHFINLASLLTSRDNLRQGVADLFALRKALDTFDYDGGGADFDPTQVRFVGHSLGAMVGGVFMALEPTVSVGAGVLGMPGGAIAKVLDGSAYFGPILAGGLAANGVVKGTADYESFLAVAQTALDTADPLNYTAKTVDGRGVLLFRVKDDGTVPNTVMPTNLLLPPLTVPSFLAGTDPLATILGLQRTTDTTSGTNVRALVRFNAGNHRSLLDPTSSAAVTAAMQGAAATFVLTNGGTVSIPNTSVVE